MPLATVLVPLDGSQLAEAALEYLPTLQAMGELRVTLIGVSASDEANRVNPATYLAELAEATQKKLELEVDWICRRGTPDAQILAEAANPWIVMLLMSSHGKSGIEPWRLGSVADKVIRGASCPTLVVSPAAARRKAPDAFRRILVPLDGSALAEEALTVATGFVRKLGSNLSLVAAYVPPAVPPVPWPGSTYADFLESSALAAEGYLTGLELDDVGDEVERAAVHGHPAEVLLSQIAERSIDLVIMTSHGRHGFVRWALGSVTDRLIRGPVPVLVIQPGQGERLVKLLAT
ncbi:MAG: hypothetical protein GEU75_14840 [Dehalococcoidia bacterium]|nr:hypothetical protein [Dehalococcoidia bacterium]